MQQYSNTLSRARPKVHSPGFPPFDISPKIHHLGTRMAPQITLHNYAAFWATISPKWWPKVSIARIWEPKILQNGVQNGAKAPTADPYETCAGMHGLHVHTPPGSSILAHFSKTAKK